MSHELFSIFVCLDSLCLETHHQFLTTLYKEAVGLVLGMYCDNNALFFVSVAKDLLDSVDFITGISTVNFELTIWNRMREKKLKIKLKYGNTF